MVHIDRQAERKEGRQLGRQTGRTKDLSCYLRATGWRDYKWKVDNTPVEMQNNGQFHSTLIALACPVHFFSFHILHLFCFCSLGHSYAITAKTISAA